MIIKKIMAKIRDDMSRAGRLIPYVLSPETRDCREKCVRSECLNFCGSNDPERLAAEMLALVQFCGSARPKGFLQHWMMSWPEMEKPDTGDIIKASRVFLEKMGLENNQAVVGVHVDTENIHAHIAVSRINPAEMKLVDDGNDILKAHSAVAMIEAEMGCLPEHNAMFVRDPFRGAIRNPWHISGNSLNLSRSGSGPLTLLMSHDLDPGDFPGFVRKGNLYRSRSSGELAGVIENSRLHLFKWTYKDIVKKVIELKKEENCRVVVRADMLNFVSDTKMSPRQREDFMEANFNSAGNDRYTGAPLAQSPNDPLVLARMHSILPSVPFSSEKPPRDIWRYYMSLKNMYAMRGIARPKLKCAVSVAMRHAGIARADIEEALRRDGAETAVARHICSWLYSEGGDTALYKMHAENFLPRKNKSGFGHKKGRAVTVSLAPKMRYDLSASEIIIESRLNMQGRSEGDENRHIQAMRM